MATAADKVINDGLRRFQTERQQGRRFHAATLGKDVNPEYCFADFLCKVAGHDRKGLEKTYGPETLKTALHETQGGMGGGYLVPEELRYELLISVAEKSIFRKRATVLPMKTLTLNIPVPDTTTAAAGVSPFFGGFTPLFAEENTTLAESEPKFRKVQLTAKVLACYALLSNPMLDDGGQALEAYLRSLIAIELAWKEDSAFLVGDGVGAPQGIVNAAGTQTVTRNLVNKFSYKDAAVMMQNCVTFDNAIWLVAKSAQSELSTLIDGAGRSSWVPNTGYTQENWHYGTLFGSPCYLTEKTPALGSRGDVLLFAPELYLIGDRQEVQIDVSREQTTAFLNNQSVWRILERIDGQPLVGTPFQIQGSTQQVSPYVCLV